MRSKIRNTLRSPSTDKSKELWKVLDYSRDVIFPTYGYSLKVFKLK
jgi:hypothetical protein